MIDTTSRRERARVNRKHVSISVTRCHSYSSPFGGVWTYCITGPGNSPVLEISNYHAGMVRVLHQEQSRYHGPIAYCTQISIATLL